MTATQKEKLRARLDFLQETLETFDEFKDTFDEVTRRLADEYGEGGGQGVSRDCYQYVDNALAQLCGATDMLANLIAQADDE